MKLVENTMNCPIRERAEWEKANPITLVGGNRPYHIMSVLLAEHSRSEGIFGFLTYEDANNLRLVCKELRDEVKDFYWKDSKTRIKGSLKLWRICFRNAKAANIYKRRDLTDADFVYLKGIHTLNMSGCNQETITDAAFVHLKGIHTLNMSGCNQPTITDAAFIHLKGIHTLDITVCRNRTDAAFVHLKGIHTLNMVYCNQSTITDAAFEHLKGIHTLDMSYCNQATITDAAFAHLEDIHTLDIWGCNLRTITAAGIVHLQGCNIRR